MASPGDKMIAPSRVEEMTPPRDEMASPSVKMGPPKEETAPPS